MSQFISKTRLKLNIFKAHSLDVEDELSYKETILIMIYDSLVQVFQL